MASRVREKERARVEREQRAAGEDARERRTRRLWQLGAAVVTAAAVVIIAIVVSSAGKSKVAAPGIFNGIPQRGTVLGNPTAPVTMTEFADLQCPVCREYTAAVMPTLVQRYVRTGKVRMVYQDIAFLGNDSVKVGRAAGAAGAQNKLWQFADVAYADQGDENSGYVTDGWLRGVAAKVPGLDVNRLMAERNAPFTLQAIAQARAQGHRLGVDSTPTFFLQRGNGPTKKLDWSGLTPGSFTPAIDSALAG
jgi:protein-disulfide isomerase